MYAVRGALAAACTPRAAGDSVAGDGGGPDGRGGAGAAAGDAAAPRVAAGAAIAARTGVPAIAAFGFVVGNDAVRDAGRAIEGVNTAASTSAASAARDAFHARRAIAAERFVAGDGRLFNR